MSIKISELPQASSVSSSDTIPIVQGGTTKQANVSMLPSGGGGTTDYTDLSNKPSINSVTLSGNKTTSDLGISYADISNKPEIATTIDSTSTNSEIAGAKATYDLKNKLSLIWATHARQGITVTTAWSGVQIPVDTEQTTTGDFTISNGKIIVGSKPKVVEIDLSLTLDTINSGTYNISILRKNPGGSNVNVGSYGFSGLANVWNANVHCLTEVEEGAEIQISGTKNQATTFYCASTNLIVKTLSEVPITSNNRGLLKQNKTPSNTVEYSEEVMTEGSGDVR